MRWIALWVARQPQLGPATWARSSSAAWPSPTYSGQIALYATPAENIRAAQAAADELDNFEGEERRLMMERVQWLLDAAAAQNGADCHTKAPQRQNDDLRRDQGATSRTPTGGARGRRDK